MDKITEIKNERQRVEISYDDGAKVIIPEYEFIKIKDQCGNTISRVRDTVCSVVVPA